MVAALIRLIRAKCPYEVYVKALFFFGYNSPLVLKRSVFAQDFYEHVRAADPANPSGYGPFG